uniref:Protein HflC n=1 Tax=Candidatus Kentrum sp. FM TaxID=2126340 RepID=A0A450T9R5_9GAMM|nr:MAG: membrane protease subunit HflC [Candidatus Kentron sp. FM]VFJ63446.1 MAG: membrane protease subunit HflC [Candidatus Kentron sp. FM]VFK14442.1 MAG: membrane protease subunit HflC [Candidatus Kentron sp. FM]
MFTRKLLLTFVGLVAVVVALSIFTVDERERAVVLQLGKIVRADYGPGIHMKTVFGVMPAPSPFQVVRKFDRRIQNLDADPMRFLTSEKKNVMVDFFIKWRIQDMELFYTATSGGNMRTASDRLTTIIQKRLRDEFGKRTVVEVVSGERTEIMRALMTSAPIPESASNAGDANANDDANNDTQAPGSEDSERETVSAKDQAKRDLGVEIVDVRLKRIDWPEDVSGSVFDRMSAERTKVAKDFRSRGQEAAKTIRAEADREREVIIAEANRDAERIQGEGDGTAAEIYANAYRKDPEFYGLYRSLNAYRNTLNDRSDILIMEPDTEFFKYFKDPKG